MIGKSGEKKVSFINQYVFFAKTSLLKRQNLNIKKNEEKNVEKKTKMTKKNLEAILILIDPLEKEKRYKIKDHDERYEFREKDNLWKLTYNNNIEGLVSSSNGCNRIHVVSKIQNGQHTLKEIGLYERINGGYVVEDKDNKSKEEIHPLDYLLRVVSCSKVPLAREPNTKSLSELAYGHTPSELDPKDIASK